MTTTTSKSSAVFTDTSSYTTTMITQFVDTYGTEGFSWSPETIVMEVEDDFKVKLPRANKDRLLAGVNLITSDDFYKSLPDFINYCNVLSGDLYDPTRWDPAASSEIAWGITEGLLLSPPAEDDEDPFTDEIVAYIGALLDEEGIINPPDVLKIAVRDVSGYSPGEFSDDPIMFDAVHDFETGKTESINAAVKQGLRTLAEQLDALSLQDGDTKDAVTRMLGGLSK